ncbi:MAG: hypothetical protein AAF805_15200 [Planctomycetota bacterium]
MTEARQRQRRRIDHRLVDRFQVAGERDARLGRGPGGANKATRHSE